MSNGSAFRIQLCALALALAARAGTLYVDSASTGAAAPYGTWGTAAADIQTAAAAAQSGDEIVVAAGAYALSDEITLSSSVSIRGATGDPADVVVSAASGKRHFTLKNSDAAISSITLAHGGAPSSGGGAVSIASPGGVVTNCVIFDCKVSYGEGGAIYISKYAGAALVTHCVVTNCTLGSAGSASHSYDTQNQGGMLLKMEAGTVRNCLFADSAYLPSSMGFIGAAVFATGGTLENCTVAGNASKFASGVYASGSARIVNCLIGANSSLYNPTGHDDVWLGTASCFSNCLARVAVNEWCMSSRRLFRDEVARDWRPAGDAIDTGAGLGWMAGATDMGGGPRIVGDGPDIGCFELAQDAFSAFAVADSATAGVAPLEVAFSVAAFGGGQGGLSCEWDWDGDGTFDETTSGATASHIFATPGDYAVKVRIEDRAGGDTFTDEAVALVRARSETIYVDAASGGNVWPYATQAGAALSISDAIDAAVDGCTVEVAAGTYPQSAQLIVSKAVTLRGAAGGGTVVRNTLRSGAGARCIYLNHPQALVSGMAFENGYVNSNSDPGYGQHGGGVFIAQLGGTMSNCVVRSCSDWVYGSRGAGIYIKAGADDALVTHCVVSNCSPNSYSQNTSDSGSGLAMFGGTVRNCLFTGNRATVNKTMSHSYGTVHVGGGTFESCTVAGNTSFACAGVYATGGEVRNCAMGLNTTTGSNAAMASWAGTAALFSNCIAPVEINDSCLVENDSNTYPNAASGDYTPAATSLAIDAAMEFPWMAQAGDLAGNGRIVGGGPDIGAYEAEAAGLAVSFDAIGPTIGFAPLEVRFAATTANAGESVAYFWDWDGDGEPDEETATPECSHTFAECWDYEVGLGVVSDGASAAASSAVLVRARPRTIHVDPASASPAAPYDGPQRAAADIQTAIDYAIDGCEIILAAATHTVAVDVAVNKGVSIRGATGNPSDTIVRNIGTKDRDGSDSAHVFVMTGNGARLSGVTVTGGVIRHTYNQSELKGSGAGIYLASPNGVVTDCIVSNNIAWYWTRGGGMYVAPSATGALVDRCVFARNNVDVAQNNSTYLGAALYMNTGTVRNCLFHGNSAPFASDLRNLSSAYFTVYVGGGTLENCTVAGNSSNVPTGIYAGQGATVRNCIVAGNTASSDEAAVWGGAASAFTSCISDCVAVNGGATAPAEGMFRDFNGGDFRIWAASPATDAGAPADWMDGATDLAGRPRIYGRAPDIGCYEAQGSAKTIVLFR